jgi:hypothetical protein
MRYPERCYPDANAFRRLEWHLRQDVQCNTITLVNPCRPRTVRTPANEDAKIAAVERETWRSYTISRENMGLFKPSVIEALNDD